MMNISPQVIIGKQIEDNAPEILAMLMKFPSSGDLAPAGKRWTRGKWRPASPAGFGPGPETGLKNSWYVITTAVMDNHLMYIMSWTELRRQNICLEAIRVLGIAGSRHEAREIVCRIFDEIVSAGEISGIRQYLEEY